MRKLFLIFTAILLCSIASFAQFDGGTGTQNDPYLISDSTHFKAIAQQPNGASGLYFRQTADIDLGVYENRTSSIIDTFSGTYNGGENTITYQASFNGTTYDGNYALFGLVEGGTLENINVNADVTISGTQNNMQVALLCGKLTNRQSGAFYRPTYYDGIIRNCNVNGNINSTVSSERGGTDAGLLVGESKGQIKYCNGNGNVRGVGYVGGLIGQMSTQSKGLFSGNYESSVIGSSFIGTVTADSPSTDHGENKYGSFAGGICGFANDNTEITFCYVSASINLGNYKEDVNNQESGIVSTALNGSGSPTVTNNYAEGTINGVPMEDVACGGITNSAGNTSYNYYPGGSTTNEGAGECITTSKSSDEIAEALNNAAAGDTNIHFSPVGSSNVIFGQISISKVCEAPTNLTITNNEGTYTATWQSANADTTITEATWHWELTGGNLNVASQGSITTTTISSQLDPSPNPYTFTVYTDCSTDNTENSQSVSSTFTVACPTPTNLTASNITDNGFKISWDADVDCQLTVNGSNYEISAGNPMEKTITGLNPETTYNIIVKAKCGNEYVEQASINVTTARLDAPTGLAVNTVWNGEERFGTATITWDMVDGLTYEIDGQTGDKETGFAITGLAEDNYTLRLRAKKGDKYSDWVSMPYTISSPDAPKNPQVTYTINENGNSYDVTVSWTAGSTPNNGWIVNGGEVQNTASYVLTAQTPGSNTILAIVEKVGESTSGALQVPIQVPCLPATLPNTVSTTQTSATFTFSQAIEGRKVIIGSDEYDASATSITIDELTSGTTYSYEVREYCNETQYSSVIANFATVGCFAVKNLSVSNIGVTNATISWESQSTLAGLNYQITVNGETKPEQTATTITLTGLTSATEYTIEVKEQCGENWGEERTITFTTESGNYVTAKDGDFDFPDTWEGNKVPTGNFGNITIKHNVTLSHSLTLSGSCRISNEGVLKITSQGELINTTGNNVGGIVEVETPQKDMDKWTFIGAPFENYKLETIKPVSGSDISVSLYDYEATNWSDEWALYNTTVGRGDGYFAWPFYKGVVTYTTYGDLFDWTSETIMTSYDFSQPAKYQLNNAETFTVTKNVQEGNGGRWMALSNPYPAKLSVSKFVNANTNIASGSEASGNATIQGKCIYKLTNNVSGNAQTWDVVFANNANETVKDIAMTEGFFVNLTSGNQVTFSKDQLTNYPTSKSQVAPREFVELSLVKGNHKSKLYFAHNQEAEQNYDIFDANKLFALGEVAEPYFVTEGIALVKEEVKELPYYATMNVRSYKDDTVSFVVKNIPKDMSVFIIDNEEEIKMSEDVAYTTHISEGENADRFQVLFKKASVIEEAKDSEITITNTNRLVRVESTQTDLRIEVYNALGQKVFATNDYNFTLNEVSAGTYMIKAYNRITTQTAKIVIH